MALVLCYSAFVLIKKGYRKRRKIFGILSRQRGNSSENNGVLRKILKKFLRTAFTRLHYKPKKSAITI